MVFSWKVVYRCVLSTSCLLVSDLVNRKKILLGKEEGEEMTVGRREVDRIGWESRRRPLMPDPTCLCQLTDLGCCNSHSEEITLTASNSFLVSLIWFQPYFFLLEITIVCTTHFRTYLTIYCKILICSFCEKLYSGQQPQAKTKWANASLWNHCLDYNCWLYPATT